MSHQCVPSWELDDSPTPTKIPHQTHSNSFAIDVPSLEYDQMAELTWENGQLAMHGLGPPRVPNKSIPSYGGTLESIVNQATRSNPRHHQKSAVNGAGGDEVVPWLESIQRTTGAKDAHRPTTRLLPMTMDALVPCSRNVPNSDHYGQQHSSSAVHVPGFDGSANVGSCSGATNTSCKDYMVAPRLSAATTTRDWSSRSVSGTCGETSRQLTGDTFDREVGTTMFTSTSSGSPENTSSDKQYTNRTGDEHDSVCHSKAQRQACDEEDKRRACKNSSASTKRKRAAAIHNQSERKRRDKINQRMKTLQKLVPNSSKTDKASMLDEVIDYLKQLQAQVQWMSRMNMSPMMLPLAMQQQLQMSMLGMGMGMGLGVTGVVDFNALGRPNITGMPPFFHPSAATAAAASTFVPIASWDSSGDRLNAAPHVVPDHFAAFLASQSQPMAMDAYSRMAALYQQFQQQAGTSSGPKN